MQCRSKEGGVSDETADVVDVVYVNMCSEGCLAVGEVKRGVSKCEGEWGSGKQREGLS
jgi:hypothetical protein